MYLKAQIKAAFTSVFRGAGELWFPYAGRDDEIDDAVRDQWEKLEAALTKQPREVVVVLDEIRQIVQDWLDEQGHRRCHYYPEVLNRVAKLLGIEQMKASLLPSLEEFQEGCRRFQAEQYGLAKLQRDIAAAPTPPRVLCVGIRRFQRDAAPTSASTWTWSQMLRYPAMTATRTPTAWQRLESVGLMVADAVDLLPPGGDVDDLQAAQQARYLQGILAGLEAADQGYDVVALLGGKVSKAFRAADSRLADLRLLELRHGFITLPTPHVVETDADGWWSSETKLTRLKHVVGKLMSWRCVECVNGDGEVQGCVECGTHAVGCATGSFCVQCRDRRAS